MGMSPIEGDGMCGGTRAKAARGPAWGRGRNEARRGGDIEVNAVGREDENRHLQPGHRIVLELQVTRAVCTGSCKGEGCREDSRGASRATQRGRS